MQGSLHKKDCPMKILVVEDEKKVAAFIKKGLEEDNFKVELAYDGEKGEELATESAFDLIILDILMPKKDGLAMLEDLRAKRVATPVLMITAKGSVEDKVRGLDSGADDYLVKPFAIAELLARVRSLLRRGGLEKLTMLAVANLTLDLVSHKAIRGEKTIELTAKEYTLLEYFMRNTEQSAQPDHHLGTHLELQFRHRHQYHRRLHQPFAQ